MRESKRRKKRHQVKKRLALHWQKMLYLQLAAYTAVMVLWVLPIPNPVKLLAVSFHELSHGLAGVLTGGRVFGYAIAPGGSGVTMGIGGNMFLILIAGYIGSCVWGAFLYYISVKWKANTCLIVLELLIIGTALFGWLNQYTVLFGLGALILMTCLFPFRTPVKLFFIRLVGSACCFYAPLEVMGEWIKIGGAPSVMGMETASDIDQLAELMTLPSPIITLAVLAAQAGLLVTIIRWTCRAGAKEAIREENAEKKVSQLLLQDVRQQTRRYTLR